MTSKLQDYHEIPLFCIWSVLSAYEENNWQMYQWMIENEEEEH